MKYPDKPGEEGLTLVQRLSLRINDVANAYDLEYDGDEGKTVRAQSDAGIALDDFVMVNGHDLVKELTTTAQATRPEVRLNEIVEECAAVCDKMLSRLKSGEQLYHWQHDLRECAEQIRALKARRSPLGLTKDK